MQEFEGEARRLGRRYAVSLGFILILILGLNLATERTATRQRFYRDEQTRTGEQIVHLWGINEIAGLIAEGGPDTDRALLAAALGAKTARLTKVRACADAPGALRIAAPPEVAAMYLGPPAPTLCEIGARYLAVAAEIAAGRGDPARLLALDEAGAKIVERIAAVRATYGRLAREAEDRLELLGRTTLAAIVGLLMLQGRYVFQRGLATLRQAHAVLGERAAGLRAANEALAAARQRTAAALLSAEEALGEAESARRAAAAAHGMKTEFLACVSHEVRTPLNAVLGLTALMKAEPRTPEDLTRIGAMREAAKSLAALFDDLIELSRLGAGEVRIAAAPFDTAQIVGAQIAAVARRATEKGLAVEARIAPDAEGRFVGDAGRVGRVLLALIDNAVKHADRGVVVVGARRWGEVGLRFEVTDEGPGVPEALRERIFTPFVQTDGSATRRAGGLGIGLSLARATAEALGGGLGLSDTPVGARFWFETPALALSRSFGLRAAALGD